MKLIPATLYKSAIIVTIVASQIKYFYADSNGTCVNFGATCINESSDYLVKQL